MSIETGSTGRAPAPSRMRRRFKIVIVVVLMLAALWSLGWLAARQYAGNKLVEVEQKIADQGGTITCGGQSLSGFPFKMGLTCTPFAATCPADGLSMQMAGLEAIALIYNPGHAIFAAKGPMTAEGPGGAGLEANWKSLESSVRVGTSSLKRLSVVTDGLDATLRYPARLADPVAARADHAEFHLLESADTADAFDVFLQLGQFSATAPGKPTLPPLSTNIAVTLPAAMLRQREDPVAAWMASGAPVQLQRVDVAIAGFEASASGALTVAANGLLSGQLVVRLDALDKLPDLIETVHPGSRDKLARLIGPVSAFLKPVTVDGRTWREATVTLRDGRASMGFIPLGNIPPIGRNGPVTEAEPAALLIPASMTQIAQATPTDTPPPAKRCAVN